MRGRLLGLLLVSIPLQAASAEPPGLQASEAIALIDNARQNRAQGYLYRAEAQYRRALAIVEQTSGTQSPDLTPALNGRRPWWKPASGAGHPLLATALQDLAAIYHVQGQFAKAQPLYYRALAIREAALGPNHPFLETFGLRQWAGGWGRHRAGSTRAGSRALPAVVRIQCRWPTDRRVAGCSRYWRGV